MVPKKHTHVILSEVEGSRIEMFRLRFANMTCKSRVIREIRA